MVHRLRCSAPLKRTRTWPPTVRLRRKRASKGSAEAPCARSPSSLGSTYSIQTAESSQMNCEIHDSLHILYSADINSDPKVSRHQCLNELDGKRAVIHRRDIPHRTDLGPLPRYNCVANKSHLYGVHGGNCKTCRHHFQSQHLEVDHIISRSKGGTDHLDNLQLLCSNCNRIKGDRGMAYVRMRLKMAA